MALRSAPSVRAEMFESPLYHIMGGGTTDRLFLLGHSDGLERNVPYQVMSANDALNAMDADSESPLTKAFLEAYLAGARDIWLVSVAPMSEYEADLENRDASYYQTYSDKLIEAYDVLKEFDIAQITVPVDAPLNSSVDFLGPLANYCVEAFNLTGEIHLGIMGTRGEITPEWAQALANDPRPGQLGDGGKFVAAFSGDVAFNLQQMPTAHTSSAAAVVAGQMATLPYHQGIVYKPLKNVVNPTGPDLKHALINSMAENNINHVGRNTRGKRGRPFQAIAFSDNTMAEEGSDYWSMLQTRLALIVSSEIRTIGFRRMGVVGFGMFQREVEQYMQGLVSSDQIRGYSLHIQRDPVDRHTVYVEVVLLPYFGLREITVDILVGPEQGGIR